LKLLFDAGSANMPASEALRIIVVVFRAVATATDRELIAFLD
jgi:hypothetical protein